MKKANNLKRWFRKEHIPLWIMSLPGIVYLIMFMYAPMVGLVLAFKKYNVGKGIFGSPWVGLRNFEFLFSTTDAWVITRNTVLYNLAFIFLTMIIGVTLSIILNEIRSKKLMKTFQTVFMMPHFLSWAIISMIVSAFLAKERGVINGILNAFGMEDVSWYQNLSFWPPFIVLMMLWKESGYKTVLYLSTISGISQDYYEAAMLDGASRWQLAKYITIPHLRAIISISIIMSMAGIFRGDFGLFYTVPQNTGTLYPVTDVLDTYIYRGLGAGGSLGMSAAAGFYQSIVGFFTVLLVNWIITKVDPDSAMF